MFFLGGIFKVERQSWIEWLASIAIGVGSIPVAFLTKLASRWVPLHSACWALQASHPLAAEHIAQCLHVSLRCVCWEVAVLESSDGSRSCSSQPLPTGGVGCSLKPTISCPPEEPTQASPAQPSPAGISQLTCLARMPAPPKSGV